MLIFLLLFLVGLVLPLFCLPRFIRGVRDRDARECLIAVLIPIGFWAFLCLLSYADHRFIEKETEKNGGRRPDWVW